MKIVIIVSLFALLGTSSTSPFLTTIRNQIEKGSNKRIVTIGLMEGTDYLLPCEANSPRYYTWQKNAKAVQALTAYMERRVYIIPEQGLLLLNAELTDEGLFTCIFVKKSELREKLFQITVVPKTDEEVESNVAIQCGKIPTRGRIIGGNVIDDHRSPWTVLIWIKAKAKPLCSGTLLSHRWVVTAAHCFASTGVSAGETELRFGEQNTSNVEGQEVTVQIRRILQHPSFNTHTYDSDIALVELLQPVSFTDYIVPICLPSESTADTLLSADSARGVVTGWGRTHEPSINILGTYSDVLKKVRLSVVDQEDCGSRHEHVLTNNMFCAAAENRSGGGEGVCTGDSGGPFVMKESSRAFLIGIVSWGVGCSDPEYPGVYTKVSRFRPWPLHTINSGEGNC